MADAPTCPTCGCDTAVHATPLDGERRSGACMRLVSADGTVCPCVGRGDGGEEEG